jgi:hypothetical protein
MKKADAFGILIGAVLLTATPVSVQGTQKHLALSIDTADARVGRPLTPMSVAGVHRRAYRQTHRAVRRCAVWRGGVCARWY